MHGAKLSAGLLFVGALAASAATDSPYGYCSHIVGGAERDHLGTAVGLIRSAGCGWIRDGMTWERLQKHPGDAEWDFSVPDRAIAEMERQGISYLAILHCHRNGKPDFQKASRDPAQWLGYVTKCVERYKGRVGAWEIWNEVNILAKIDNQMSPAEYAEFLRRTYRRIKEIDPSATVTTGGFSDLPIDYLRELYKRGLKDFCDAISIHPYAWPPERSLDTRLEELKALMKEFGDERKPVWISEVGLQLKPRGLAVPGFTAAALKAVDPNRKSWRILVTDEDVPRRLATLEFLRHEFAGAATFGDVGFVDFEAKLAAEKWDAVFFPFDESYPADAMDAVEDFVAKGGTLVDLGSYATAEPCTWKSTGGRVVKFSQAQHPLARRDRNRLRFRVLSCWDWPVKAPEAVPSHITSALGQDDLPPERRVKLPPDKLLRRRYFLPNGLKKGDTFTSLIEGELGGTNYCTAALIRYGSDLKGNLVLGGWYESKCAGVTREDQALCVARTLAIAFAEGVDRLFWYALAPRGGFDMVDPFKFDGTLDGHVAYGAFVRMRPAGSVNLDGEWHDAKRNTYYPRWKRPDGSVAGALWSLKEGDYSLGDFTGARFSDHLGRLLAKSPVTGDRVHLTDHPVYFEFPATFKSERIKTSGTNLLSRLHPTYTSLYNGANATARPVPAHLGRSVIYQLFPRMFTPEGTFTAAAAKLPRLKDLGVDIVYLTPHQLMDDDPDPKHWSARQRSSGCGNAKNPYRQKDYFAVDPEYGTSEDLRNFVARVHELGLKVWFDVVYFHCGPTAVFLKDHPEYVVRNPDGSPRLGDWAFPEMDLSKKEVREYLWSNMTYLVRTYGVDGFRCDVGDMLPVEFWEEGSRRCRALKPDFTMMCEGLRADDQLEAFDLEYGFYVQWTLVEFLKGTEKASMLETAWRAERRDFPKGNRWMRCFENHDFANVEPGEKRKEELYGENRNEAMLVTLFLLDGVPMVYNGQEIADAARHSIFSNRDHGAFGIDWSRADDAKARRRFAKVRELAALRHAHPELFDCPLVWNGTDDPDRKYSFSRLLADGRTLTLTVDIVSGDYAIDMRTKGAEQ